MSLRKLVDAYVPSGIKEMLNRDGRSLNFHNSVRIPDNYPFPEYNPKQLATLEQKLLQCAAQGKAKDAASHQVDIFSHQFNIPERTAVVLSSFQNILDLDPLVSLPSAKLLVGYHTNLSADSRLGYDINQATLLDVAFRCAAATHQSEKFTKTDEATQLIASLFGTIYRVGEDTFIEPAIARQEAINLATEKTPPLSKSEWDSVEYYLLAYYKGIVDEVKHYFS